MASIDLNHLPHTVAIWRKYEVPAYDGTGRIQTPSYVCGEVSEPCWMEPLSATEKAGLGYAFDANSYRAWFAVSAKLKATTGDVLIYDNVAYQVDDWTVYDSGPTAAQHVEAMSMRLPAIPAGVTFP